MQVKKYYIKVFVSCQHIMFKLSVNLNVYNVHTISCDSTTYG